MAPLSLINFWMIKFFLMMQFIKPVLKMIPIIRLWPVIAIILSIQLAATAKVGLRILKFKQTLSFTFDFKLNFQKIILLFSIWLWDEKYRKSSNSLG